MLHAWAHLRVRLVPENWMLEWGVGGVGVKISMGNGSARSIVTPISWQASRHVGLSDMSEGTHGCLLLAATAICAYEAVTTTVYVRHLLCHHTLFIAVGHSCEHFMDCGGGTFHMTRLNDKTLLRDHHHLPYYRHACFTAGNYAKALHCGPWAGTQPG